MVHFSPALAQGARPCARSLTRTQRLQAAWAARRTKTTAASTLREKSAGQRLVPAPHQPARPSSVLSGAGDGRLKTKASTSLRLSEKVLQLELPENVTVCWEL